MLSLNDLINYLGKRDFSINLKQKELLRNTMLDLPKSLLIPPNLISEVKENFRIRFEREWVSTGNSTARFGQIKSLHYGSKESLNSNILGLSTEDISAKKVAFKKLRSRDLERRTDGFISTDRDNRRRAAAQHLSDEKRTNDMKNKLVLANANTIDGKIQVEQDNMLADLSSKTNNKLSNPINKKIAMQNNDKENAPIKPGDTNSETFDNYSGLIHIHDELIHPKKEKTTNNNIDKS